MHRPPAPAQPHLPAGSGLACGLFVLTPPQPGRSTLCLVRTTVLADGPNLCGTPCPWRQANLAPISESTAMPPKRPKPGSTPRPHRCAAHLSEITDGQHFTADCPWYHHDRL